MTKVGTLCIGSSQESVNSCFTDMFQMIFINCSQIAIFPINFSLSRIPKMFMGSPCHLDTKGSVMEEKLD